MTKQNATQHFAQCKADFMKVKAVLRFQPEVKTRVRDEFDFDQVIVNPNGTLFLTTHFSSTEPIQKILSYGSQVTVTEPPGLIKELQRHIQNMAELYKL
jgi:hypothetical protein